MKHRLLFVSFVIAGAIAGFIALLLFPAQSSLGGVGLSGILSWGIAFAALSILSRDTIQKIILPASGAYPMAWVRVLVCAILCVSLLWENVASLSHLPTEMRVPMGYIQFLDLLPHQFRALLFSHSFLSLLKGIGVAALFAGLLGQGGKTVMAFGAMVYFVCTGLIRSYSWFYHTGLVPLYLLVLLCFLPCLDALTLSKRKRKTVNPEAYSWGLLSCWLVLSLCYGAAGLSKLRIGGFEWFGANTLRYHFLRDNIEPMQFSWQLGVKLLKAPDVLFTSLAIATVMLEVSFLLIPWSKKVRRVLPPLILAFHLGCWAIQRILFFDLIFLQAIFYLSNREVRADSKPWRLGPVIAAFLITLFSSVWLSNITYFPLTAMNMYAEAKPKPELTYFRVVAKTESGEEFAAPISTVFGALADTRYRMLFRKAGSNSERMNASMKLLRAFLAESQALNGVHTRIRAATLEHWRWNYAAELFPGKLLTQATQELP